MYVYVPTPEKIDRWQVKQDLEKFGRNFRLKIYYLDQPTPYFSETAAFRAPSNWAPIIRDVQLEMYLIEIEEEILKLNEEGKNYPNLSKEERQALKKLIEDKNIIIKSADKDSAIVIWHKDDYLKECNEQLRNTNVYEKCDQFQPKELNKKIKSVLSRMLSRKEIDKKDYGVFDKEKTTTW